MLRTFNCGVGMVLVCKPDGVERTLRGIKERGEDAFRIGEIKERFQGLFRRPYVFLGGSYEAETFLKVHLNVNDPYV